MSLNKIYAQIVAMKIQSSMMGLLLVCSLTTFAQKINRKLLVGRHRVTVKSLDSLSALSVGNGKFAFTVDATGLQTFPDLYKGGIPLGTQSEWGWDSLKDTADYKIEESLRDYNQYGRKISYTVQVKSPERNKRASDWFRQNVHRLQLGNIGLVITLKNGREVKPADIQNIRQQLDLWTGEIHSFFTVEGEKVEVYTLSHPVNDQISVKVKSALVAQGRLKIRIRYPYPTGNWADTGTNYAAETQHQSAIFSADQDHALITHQLDSAKYFSALHWNGAGTLLKKAAHEFILSPAIKPLSTLPPAKQNPPGKNTDAFRGQLKERSGSLERQLPEKHTKAPANAADTFELSVLFSPVNPRAAVPLFAETEMNSKQSWMAFWLSGGAIDFSGSTDPRAHELERRVILSQYLTRVQCAGNVPPQETGLTYNSWFGKPHLEMTWWHLYHYALWGRADIMERQADWYFKVAGAARKLADRQGFEGLRWQKMTDNNGNESPSSVGALLIWQQPHIITFAGLSYRAHPDRKTLEKYKDLVFGTADFMASFAHYNKEKDRYELGPGVIPAQERYKAEETFNPTYELAYWNQALNTAQQWKVLLGLKREARWDNVLDKLSALPVQDGVYLAAESARDSYTNPAYQTDHPSVLGTYGMLPETKLLDKQVMRNTFDLVWKIWSWEDTWGWDFPMTAMTAARLGKPEQAVDALLMKVKTNTYLVNGHNYQDERLRLYLPGNGGLLTAVAMMCAGWDGNTVKNPGFPKNGKWKVTWEGLKPMP